MAGKGLLSAFYDKLGLSRTNYLSAFYAVSHCEPCCLQFTKSHANMLALLVRLVISFPRRVTVQSTHVES